MPKYLEQLPDESLIKQLYTQQKANTTDAALLKIIENLDSGIQQLVDHKRKYDEKIIQGDITIMLEEKKQHQEVEHLLKSVGNTIARIIFFYVRAAEKQAHEIETLARLEGVFLVELLDAVWYKPRHRGGTSGLNYSYFHA